jgi:hypothetical protein
MPLRRPPEPPPREPSTNAPPTPPEPETAGPSAPPAAPPSPEADSQPGPAQLRAAARELASTAERTERAAREILGRAHTLCESRARSLEASEHRSARDTLSVLLTGLLLAAAAAVLATLVTLAVIAPRFSVLDLLRILLHAG